MRCGEQEVVPCARAVSSSVAITTRVPSSEDDEGVLTREKGEDMTDQWTDL
jgi:hypothetical protein